MRSTQIAIGVALIMAMSSALKAQSKVGSLTSPLQVTGEVRGTVMDFNEAVIPNAAVIFERYKTKVRVVSNEAGNYMAELPTGEYRVTTEIYGFSPFRRAAFKIQSNTPILINIVPVPQAISYGTVAPQFYYESFSVPALNNSLDLLIRFRTQRKYRGIIEYRKVLVSYDVLTIYADSLRLNQKAFRLEANGNVVVEDGKQRVHVKRAEVEFKTGEPIIKLTR